MAQLGNLIVTGVTRLLSKLYVNDSVTAPTFIGKLQGNADTATSATKLTTSAGAETQGVYFKDGKPVVTKYTVNANVPADAKFTDTNTWRGVQNNLTSTATDQSLSAAQGKVLNDKFASYVPTSRTVNGKALSANISLTASDVGASASGHTHNYNDLSNKPTLGTAASKTVRTLTAAGASGWKDVATDQGYVPDMSFIAYWNGAYSGSTSNLAYCKHGAFGTAATSNKGDFATAGHTHSNYLTNITSSMVTNALGYTPPKSDTNTWIALKGATTDAAGTAGYAPAPSAGAANRYLRSDGTWAVPPDNNTTYSNMTAATSSAAGKAGLVPAPAAGKQTSFLRGDGTWVVPTNTTYSNFVKSGTGAKAGLVPAPSTTAGTTKYLREDGTWVAPPDTKYSLPTASTSLGGVKTTSSVTSNSGYTACPIISGVVYYKDTNTTYSAASASANGLMTSTAYSALDTELTQADVNAIFA